jgi:hypothetical protein
LLVVEKITFCLQLRIQMMANSILSCNFRGKVLNSQRHEIFVL